MYTSRPYQLRLFDDSVRQSTKRGWGAPGTKRGIGLAVTLFLLLATYGYMLPMYFSSRGAGSSARGGGDAHRDLLRHWKKWLPRREAAFNASGGGGGTDGLDPAELEAAMALLQRLRSADGSDPATDGAEEGGVAGGGDGHTRDVAGADAGEASAAAADLLAEGKEGDPADGEPHEEGGEGDTHIGPETLPADNEPGGAPYEQGTEGKKQGSGKAVAAVKQGVNSEALGGGAAGALATTNTAAAAAVVTEPPLANPPQQQLLVPGQGQHAPPPPLAVKPSSSSASSVAASAASAPAPDADLSPPPEDDGPVALRAVDWTRRRILAFQAGVMGGGALGSRMPQYTQREPFDLEPEWADPGALAALGVMVHPFFSFSARYGVSVRRGMVTWIDDLAPGESVPPVEVVAVPGLGDAAAGLDGTAAGGPALKGSGLFTAAPTSPWSPQAAIVDWEVTVPTVLAPAFDTPWSWFFRDSDGGPQQQRARTEAAFNPWAQAKAVAMCPLEHLPGPGAPQPLFLDFDRLRRSIMGEGRYPPLNPLLQAGGGDVAAMGHALFRGSAQQPVPGVATFFNVVIGATGYVFARKDGGGFVPDATKGGGGGTGPVAGQPTAFRPIQCLYREFNKDRGGNEAEFVAPTTEVDEVVVLSQMWGEFVFHLYEENFIRLATMLDYVAAHPHVRVHVRLHADSPSAPHGWLKEIMDVFGIAHSRAVFGPVAAKIAHVPEGMPCGEPYAHPQLLLRETLRQRLSMRHAVDVWGDGGAVAYGYSHGTNSAPPRMALAGQKYLAALHDCIATRYSQLAGGAPHPLLPLMKLASASAVGPGAPPPPAPPPGVKPKVLLIERQGSRQVFNFGELKAALEALPINLVVFRGHGSQEANLRDFSNVDVIVGPHGAGQTNSIVAWPGSYQVEFIPESGLSNLVYTQMALLLGQDFTSFTPAGSSYYGGFVAEQARVRDAVKAVLSLP